MRLKPSEAMRRGLAMSRPLIQFLVRKGPEGNLYSCALGAMYLGNGGDPNLTDSEMYKQIEATWPELKQNIPSESGVYTQLATAIWQKNDIENLSREQIATWLEEEGY